MTDTLVIAVPSKGRLQENAQAFFARAGLDIKRSGNARNYRGRFADVEGAEIAFLSASEITNELAAGTVHLGITGEDLVRERIPEHAGVVEFVTPLGFGHADVVVAVPRAWIDVRNIGDLADVSREFRVAHGRRMRVATKYSTLTGAFFGQVGVVDYRIVESLGATEGAPAAGTAEIIVDITTTGATLAANDLKVPDGCVILRSEANLVASLRAEWGISARAALAHVLDHVAAEERARAIYELRTDGISDIPEVALLNLMAETGSVLVGMEGNIGTLHVPHVELHRITAALKREGATRISVFAPGYVFEAENPLLARLLEAIGD